MRIRHIPCTYVNILEIVVKFMCSAIKDLSNELGGRFKYSNDACVHSNPHTH